MQNLITKFLSLCLVALLFAGCSSNPNKDDQADGDSSGPKTTQTNGSDGASTSGINQGGKFQGSPLDDPNSPLYNKAIYFDFDQAEIRSEFVPMLRAHAAYLTGHPVVTIQIEGHADERGSREYNIALGERRALAVKRFLEAEGVDSVQLTTISYGEEQPIAFGHDEASWEQNRRAQLVY